MADHDAALAELETLRSDYGQVCGALAHERAVAVERDGKLRVALAEVDRLRAENAGLSDENERLLAVVLAGQEARAVEEAEPFDYEHAKAAWAAYDIAVERLEADSA